MNDGPLTFRGKTTNGVTFATITVIALTIASLRLTDPNNNARYTPVEFINKLSEATNYDLRGYLPIDPISLKQDASLKTIYDGLNEDCFFHFRITDGSLLPFDETLTKNGSVLYMRTKSLPVTILLLKTTIDS